MFYHGHHDRVPHGVVGFVVGGGKLVAVRGTHEAGCFAGRDEAGFPVAGVVEEQELATAASFGGAETPREVVEAEFEDLLAVAGAAVAGEDAAVVSREFVEQFLVLGRDEGEEGGGALLIEDRGVPVDQVAEGLRALGGAGH